MGEKQIHTLTPSQPSTPARRWTSPVTTGVVCRSATPATTQTIVVTTVMSGVAPSQPVTPPLSSPAPTDAASAHPLSVTATMTAETTPPLMRSTVVSAELRH